MPFSSGPIGLLVAVAMLAGCHSTLEPGAGRSPLRPPQMSCDSVVLEVFRIRTPFGDEEANAELWREVDEQHVPVDIRRRLARNGFRVGLIGGQIPISLSRLLELKDKTVPTTEANEVALDQIDEKPPVERAHMTLRCGLRGEIVASAEYDRLPALMLDDAGELGGQTYRKAQGVLAVKAQALSDGRVRLELTPELHHDAPRPRYVGRQGMWRIEPGRPRRAFDDLAFSATLSPGSMLLMSSLPSRPASLGHYFLTEDEDQLTQKLILVRLCQTQHDQVCLPAEVLDLEEAVGVDE